MSRMSTSPSSVSFHAPVARRKAAKSRLAGASTMVSPVTFPPSRAKLATKPLLPGSLTNIYTTGIVFVALIAQRTAFVVILTPGWSPKIRTCIRWWLAKESSS